MKSNFTNDRELTPDHGRAPRCNSCVHSTIVQGYALSQRLVHCSVFERRIPFPVYECTSHATRGMSLWTMLEIGQVIEINNGKIGFRTLKDGEQHDLHRRAMEWDR